MFLRHGRTQRFLHALTQYKPSTTVEEGVDHFVRWYRAYYGI